MAAYNVDALDFAVGGDNQTETEIHGSAKVYVRFMEMQWSAGCDTRTHFMRCEINGQGSTRVASCLQFEACCTRKGKHKHDHAESKAVHDNPKPSRSLAAHRY